MFVNSQLLQCGFTMRQCSQSVVAAGRFEDDFVSSRLKQLQLWIDRMCKHPVISHSEVFVHFLSCTDDKVLCVL